MTFRPIKAKNMDGDLENKNARPQGSTFGGSMEKKKKIKLLNME